MKKAIFLGAVLFTAVTAVSAADLGNGFSLSGGVKTGLMMKNSDYGGNLNGLNLENEYPLTLYFASADHEAYNGEGWLNFNFEQKTEGVKYGLNLGMWGNGNLTTWEKAVNLGDHYLWAKFFQDEQLQIIGGEGGGTPIKSGGWLDADWLGYNGLRVFWVDPIGVSVGINFPDPGKDGIKPVNYLSTIIIGAKYEDKPTGLYWISLMWDNNPIYDDSESNYDGGLHRTIETEENPVGLAGNAAFGLGLTNIFAGKGNVSIDGIVSNIGESDLFSPHGITYKIPQLKSTFALKANYPVTDNLFIELKGKYLFTQGDNADLSGAAYWGQLQVEPYISYLALGFVKAELSVNYTQYINSYYLAEKALNFEAGQVPGWEPLLDYVSTYQITVKPSLVFSFSGITAVLGYNGIFSRDHLENKFFLDARWSF
ncbi:MAG: hypothetical protein LBE74_02135 [Treponema sp.]|jgi:hypothetical protein|nr:hypothetical protein [Treponema sp.]